MWTVFSRFFYQNLRTTVTERSAWFTSAETLLRFAPLIEFILEQTGPGGIKRAWA